MQIKKFFSVITASLITATAVTAAPTAASAETIPMEWKPYDKGYVTIVFDDNLADLDDVYSVITGKYNFPLCTAVPSATLPRNLELLRTIEDHGGEILAHGHSHAVLLEGVSDAVIEKEYRTSYEKLTEAGFNVNGTIKCGGNTDGENDPAFLEYVEQFSSKYFKYADRSGSSTQYVHPRTWMKGIGVSKIKSYIDQAAKDKEWLVLFAHSTNETPIKMLEQVAKYLKEQEQAGKIEVITYRDLHKKFAKWEKPVDLGDTLYTVDYYSTDNETLLTSVVVKAGEAAADPTDLQVASGVKFRGWSENTDKITDNLKVYAECTYTDGSKVQLSDPPAVKLKAHDHSWSAEYETSEDGHNRTCTDCGEKEDVQEHTPGAAATEEAAQTCTVCGYVIEEKLEHTHKWGDTWESDRKGHWRICADCGEAETVQKHKAGNAATQDSPQTCTVCDYVIKQAIGHIHHSKKVAAVDATCAKDGNIAHYTCSCGKLFADKACKTEIDRDDVIVPATDQHTDKNGDGKCDICKKSIKTTVGSTTTATEASKPTSTTTAPPPDTSEPEQSEPEQSEPTDAPVTSEPDTSEPDVSEPVVADPVKKSNALPYILVGAGVLIVAATGVIVWLLLKKKKATNSTEPTE